MLIFISSIQEEVLRILTLADLHYDPLYLDNASADSDECRIASGAIPAPAGRIGCDSPIGLIDQAIKDSSKRGPFDMVFTMGDFPAHGLIKRYPTYNDRNTSNKATKYVATQISAQFPDSLILGVLGNNEGDNNYNYTTQKNSLRLKELYEECNYNKIVNNNQKFLEYGYYSQKTKYNITVIALNQNFYSERDQPQVKDNPDPGQQFEFLEKELQEANKTNQQVIILYHGSFGVNGFNSMQNSLDRFTQSYYDIVKKYEHLILCDFIGHYHQDQFRYRMQGRRAITPGFLVPSISTSNGNNPGFRVTELKRENGKWFLYDYEQYFLDLNMANYNATHLISQENSFNFQFQYRFSDAYALYARNSKKTYPDAANIQWLNEMMKVDDELYSKWMATSNLNYAPKQAENICAIAAKSEEEYKECVKTYKYDK